MVVTCDLLEVTNGPVGITRPIGIVSTCTCTCKFWANHTYAGGNCVKKEKIILRGTGHRFGIPLMKRNDQPADIEQESGSDGGSQESEEQIFF